MKSVGRSKPGIREKGAADALMIAAVLTLVVVAAVLQIVSSHQGLFVPLYLVAGGLIFIALLCSVHLKLIGNRSTDEIKIELNAQLTELEQLIELTRLQIRSFEHERFLKVRGITPLCKEIIANMNRVVGALELRYNETKRRVVGNSSEVAVVEAYELFNAPLDVLGSRLDSLIDTDPIPPLLPEEWAPRLSAYVNDLEHELNRLAAVRHVA